MPTFVDIATTDIDTDSPVTQVLMTGLRDNTESTANSDTNAFYIATQWHPYNSSRVGDAFDGEIYDHAVDGTVASVETPDFVSGYDYLIILDDVSHSLGSSETISVGLFNFGTSLYEAANAVTASFAGTGTRSSYVEIPYPQRSSRNKAISFTSPGLAGGGGFASSSATTVSKARVLPTSSANIDSGKIYLYRRKTFL